MKNFIVLFFDTALDYTTGNCYASTYCNVVSEALDLAECQAKGLKVAEVRRVNTDSCVAVFNY